MDNFTLPRKLSDAELAEIVTMKAREKEIYTAAGWFLPIPDGHDLSPLGDKTVAYVNDGREILDENEAELSAFLNKAELDSADDLHDQAQKIEDLAIENLVAPHNVSLISGAAAKKLVDNEYSVLKSLARISNKWKAAVERLGARYKGQGPHSSKA